jgi:hypothetical protein
VSNSALHFCNINVINTNHSCVLTGISTTRDEDDQSVEGTERLIIRLTIIVQNMTRQKENVLMETSKSQRICLFHAIFGIKVTVEC